jgi:hypothetical protein
VGCDDSNGPKLRLVIAELIAKNIILPIQASLEVMHICNESILPAAVVHQ